MLPIEPECDRPKEHSAPDSKHRLYLAEEVEGRSNEGNGLPAFGVPRQLSGSGAGGQCGPVLLFLEVGQPCKGVCQERVNDRAKEDHGRDQVEWLGSHTPNQDCGKRRELCVPIAFEAWRKRGDRGW